MNDVMDAFVSAHSRVRRLKMSLIVQYTYKFTKHTSPMRRLLVDMYAHCSQSTDVVNVSLRELPAEFDEDVFQALNEPRLEVEIGGNVWKIQVFIMYERLTREPVGIWTFTMSIIS